MLLDGVLRNATRKQEPCFTDDWEHTHQLIFDHLEYQVLVGQDPTLQRTEEEAVLAAFQFACLQKQQGPVWSADSQATKHFW